MAAPNRGDSAGPTPAAGAPRARALPRSPRAVETAVAAARLPPALLVSLQAFDAAVRLGSFRAAAGALHLTPSAISHRIKGLERALGDSLFTRTHREIRPTAAGKALAAATGRAFNELARAAAPAEGVGSRRRLRLAALPLFASAWLIPRVAGFMAAHPHIELVIETLRRPVDLDVEAFDAALRVGDGQWPGLTAVHLMQIHATPVTTRAIARRLRLRRPADLARAPLIHVTSFPRAWPIWLEHAGAATITPRRAIWADSFGAALEAAEQGAGVALGLEPLSTERERAGAVCPPLPVSLPTGGYWLVHRTADQSHPALRTFKRWLLAEVAGSMS